MKLYRTAEMKLAEKCSDELGINYTRLMENAGSAAAAFIRRTFDLTGRRCAVVCGSGNNGGDGFVVARKLDREEPFVAEFIYKLVLHDFCYLLVGKIEKNLVRIVH